MEVILSYADDAVVWETKCHKPNKTFGSRQNNGSRY